MPNPPLPLELVDLVISHAAWDLPQDERLEECARLALVCRDWTNPAQRCALHAVELTVPFAERALDTTVVGRLLALPPEMLAHVRKLEVRPDSLAFVHAAGSPMSSTSSLLPLYENALSALLDACPNIIDLSFCSQNMAAFVKTLDALKRHHLQNLGVTINLSHASHARSAGRLLAHKFCKLDHLELTLHVLKDIDEPVSVVPPSAPLSVANISLITPKMRTSWSHTIVDELFESLDASELFCAAGEINEDSLGFARWVATSERRSAISVKIPEPALGGLFRALSEAIYLSHLVVQVPIGEPDYPVETSLSFDDLVDLLPDSLEDIELTDWIFDIPSSVITVHAPATACDRLPILRLSTRLRHSGNDWTETTFLKLQFEDEVTRWLRSAPEAEADLYVYFPSKSAYSSSCSGLRSIMSHGLP